MNRSRLEGLVAHWRERAVYHRAQANDKNWTDWVREGHSGQATSLCSCADGLESILAEAGGVEIPAALGRQELEAVAIVSDRGSVSWRSKRILPVGTALYATATDWPECSGDPDDCPENEGFGCCKSAGEITLTANSAEAVEPVLTEADGEQGPVAWLHTLHMELDQRSRLLTFCEENPFGEPGGDYSEEYSVTSEPLYQHPAPQARAEVTEMAERVCDAYSDMAGTGWRPSQMIMLRALEAALAADPYGVAR